MMLAPTWLEMAHAYEQWQQLAPAEQQQPLRLTRGQGFCPPDAKILVVGHDAWYLTLHPTKVGNSVLQSHRPSQ